MKQGWTYNDIDTVDFFHLMEILNRNNKKVKKAMDLGEFVDKIQKGEIK